MPHLHFVKAALRQLVEMLLEQLVKQDEGQDKDDTMWSLSMAGGTCLGLIATAVGDDVVPLVMPFVQVRALGGCSTRIQNPWWVPKSQSFVQVCAFGGCSTLTLETLGFGNANLFSTPGFPTPIPPRVWRDRNPLQV